MEEMHVDAQMKPRQTLIQMPFMMTDHVKTKSLVVLCPKRATLMNRPLWMMAHVNTWMSVEFVVVQEPFTSVVAMTFPRKKPL